MKNGRKALLLTLCLSAALLLSACHTETDPWPAGSGSGLNPVQTSDATNAPQTVEETQVPGGSEDPGLNG